MSRVLSTPSLRLDDHSSGTSVAERRVESTLLRPVKLIGLAVSEVCRGMTCAYFATWQYANPNPAAPKSFLNL